MTEWKYEWRPEGEQAPPLPIEAVTAARELIRSHGRRAAQRAVDEVQAALRRDDEGAAIAADLVLRAVERMIWQLGNAQADAIQSHVGDFTSLET